MARVGPQRHRKKEIKKISISLVEVNRINKTDAKFKNCVRIKGKKGDRM
jgi:ribosomal protein L17